MWRYAGLVQLHQERSKAAQDACFYVGSSMDQLSWMTGRSMEIAAGKQTQKKWRNSIEVVGVGNKRSASIASFADDPDAVAGGKRRKVAAQKVGELIIILENQAA